MHMHMIKTVLAAKNKLTDLCIQSQQYQAVLHEKRGRSGANRNTDTDYDTKSVCWTGLFTDPQCKAMNTAQRLMAHASTKTLSECSV